MKTVFRLGRLCSPSRPCGTRCIESSLKLQKETPLCNRLFKIAVCQGQEALDTAEQARTTAVEPTYSLVVSVFSARCEAIQIYHYISILSIGYMPSMLFYIAPCTHQPLESPDDRNAHCFWESYLLDTLPSLLRKHIFVTIVYSIMARSMRRGSHQHLQISK